MSIKSEKAALDILKTYSGMNPLILRMKRDIIGYQKVSLLNDFAIDYILTNKDREPQLINKTLPVADWYGKSLQEKYEIEFAPAKIKIGTPMEQIMQLFDDTKAWNLPVVDEDGHYIGFMSKSKIFNSYREILVDNFSGD